MTKLLETKKEKIIFGAGAIVVVAILAVILIAVLGGNNSKGFRSVRVSEIVGTATVTFEEKEYAAYKDMKLEEGHDLITGAESFVRMVLDEDKYIRVEEDSKITFETLGKEGSGKTAIRLEYGAITNEAATALGEGEEYIINTPNTILAIKGTFFRVAVDVAADGTVSVDIFTYGGAVECKRVLPNGEVVDESVLIEAGYKTKVYMNDEDTVYQVEEADGKENVAVLSFEEIPDADIVDMYVASANGHEMYISTEEIWDVIEEREIEIEDYTSNRDGSDIPDYEQGDVADDTTGEDFSGENESEENTSTEDSSDVSSSTEEDTDIEDTTDENDSDGDSTGDSTIEEPDTEDTSNEDTSGGDASDGNASDGDSSGENASDGDSSTEEPDTERVEGSIEWTQIELVAGVNSFALPCSFETICDVTGLLIVAEDAELMIDPGATEYVNLYDPNFDYGEEYRQHAMTVLVYNSTEEAILATDCLVVEVMQDIYDMDFGAPTFTFPGEIQVYQELTLEQAIELFGTPDEIVDNSAADGSYVSYDYTFRVGNNVLLISTTQDQISSITLRKMD